jgi:hypothetical protein
MLRHLLTFNAFFIGLSAIGLLFFPSAMLSVVGIQGNEQLNFLLRTSGVGILALVPVIWAARANTASPVSRAAIMGLAGYMFLSSLVDLLAYLQSIVNASSVPSIIFRVFIGIALLWLMDRDSKKGN